MTKKYAEAMRAGAKPFEEKSKDIYYGLNKKVDDQNKNIAYIQYVVNCVMENKYPEYAKVREEIEKTVSKYDDALLQYSSEYVDEAKQIFEKAAKIESIKPFADPSAFYFLGEIYRCGLGSTDIDYEKSKEYYLKGAEHNDILCKYKIAEYFPEELSVGITKTERFKEVFQKLKNKTNENVFYAYEQAMMYYYGYGTSIDCSKAKSILTKISGSFFLAKQTQEEVIKRNK